MKIIPSFVHGILDYVVGIALLLAPNIFGFADVGGAAVMIPRVLGVIVLIQALCTDYEVGVAKILSLRAHLVNDYVLGAFLALSPWLFGFSQGPGNQWLPHLLVGMSVVLVSALTEPFVSRQGTPASRAV